MREVADVAADAAVVVSEPDGETRGESNPAGRPLLRYVTTQQKVHELIRLMTPTCQVTHGLGCLFNRNAGSPPTNEWRSTANGLTSEHLDQLANEPTAALERTEGLHNMDNKDH